MNGSGSLFRPKYPPEGMTYKEARAAGLLRESPIWRMKYRDSRGIVHKESTHTANKDEAKRLLKIKVGRATEGKPVIPHAERITVTELAEDLQTEYRVNGRRSAARLEFSLQHLLRFFGAMRATRVGPADVRAYIAQRQEAGAANATINRELAALKRMFKLGVNAEKVYRAPHIPLLREHNVRKGFFEREQFEAVRNHLPAYLRPVITFAYITGWRRGEVLSLQWPQVDFAAGTVRLEPGTTKNDDGRLFVMTPELRECLEAQRARTPRDVPWVFSRDGEQIGEFRKSWRTACEKAGVPPAPS